MSNSTIRSVTVQRETISGMVANPINIIVTPAVVVSLSVSQSVSHAVSVCVCACVGVHVCVQRNENLC